MGNQIKYSCKKLCEFLFGKFDTLDEESSSNSSCAVLLKNGDQLNLARSHSGTKVKHKRTKSKTIGVEMNTITSNKPSDNQQGTSEPVSNVNIYSSINTILNKTVGSIGPNDFIQITTLGKGAFGKVKLVKYTRNNEYYAMKILRKEFLRKSQLKKHTQAEQKIMQLIDNEFIVKLFFSFQTNDCLYMVLEFMQGGELFFHLKKQGKFSEKRTKLYAGEMILALEHLHKHQIIYRDLKPENVLVDPLGHIKLTDFGLSKMLLDIDMDGRYSHRSDGSNSPIENGQKITFTICGTPEYLCPEVMTGKGYDKSVDWWSLGVIIYEMIHGYPPYLGSDSRNMINYSSYLKPLKFSQNISREAENLIRSLLQMDYTKRLGHGIRDAEEIKSHPFFAELNWEDVKKKKIVPEFKPIINGKEDLSNFDKSFTQDREDSSTEIPSLYFMNSESVRHQAQIPNDYERFTFIREVEDV